MERKYRILLLSSIALISLAMHFNYFSRNLMSIHVWRQTETQSTIVNFYEEGMNLFEPRRNERGEGDGVFRMEFPLMQWMVALVYKVFGNHLIITRIFMFIIGLASITGIYRLLELIFQNHILALLGAWALNFSPSFYYYTITPLPDNFALCCSLWGLVFFFGWLRKDRQYLLIFSGLFLGIGALCKLPFILYFIVPLAFFFREIYKNLTNKNWIQNAVIVSAFIALPLSWYSLVIPGWTGNGIVKGILDNNVPFIKTLDYLQHNLISTLPELLLNYGSVLFFILGFYFMVKNKSYKNGLFPIFVIWSIGILAYFLFEVNMIAKIHDYYLFPFYPALFIVVSYGAFNILRMKSKFAKYASVILLLVLPLTAHLRMKERWDPDSPGFNKDLLVFKDDLRAAAPKNALCVAGNDESHFVFLYYIDKKGWGFQDDALNAQNLKMMIGKGAEYLYSDSRKLLADKEISPMLDKLLLEKGSIRVYRLKNNINSP
jgi:hypothetical protein